MALPILETPSYELILPSTGKKVKYRPFLVKEYKILLTSVEADTSEITRIVTELVDNCTFNKLNVAKLAHFDVHILQNFDGSIFEIATCFGLLLFSLLQIAI